MRSCSTGGCRESTVSACSRPCVKRRIETPVVFLTMLGEEIYEEAALKWGAVDFIDKSRRLSIILQRLKLITDGPKLPGGGGEGEATQQSRGPAHGAAGVAQ